VTQPGNRLEMAGVTKHYGATPALSGVGMQVRTGTVHALLGGNGSGKSTLIKILAGVVEADAGTVTTIGAGGTITTDAARLTPGWARSAGLRFVHQDIAVIADLSVAENLALGSTFHTRAGGRVDWAGQRAAAQQVLDRFELGCRPDTPAGELSPSAQTLLAIARALQDDDQDGTVLVLDEPTAALPRSEVDWLLRTLRRLAADGQTILLVSHRLDEIVKVADRITVLRDGKHLITDDLGERGSYDLAELIVGEPVSRTGAVRAQGGAVTALEVRELRSGPVSGISFSVRKGEVVGVVGQVGSGRSTVLRAIYGAVPRTGTVELAGAPVDPGDVSASMAQGIRLLPERRSDIAFPNMDLAANISMPGAGRYWRGVMSRSAERRDAEQLIARLGVVAPSASAPIAALSGGNQQKVLIGAALRVEPELLLLDEPTQGVDVGARKEIHGVIHQATDAGAAVVVVSSDLEEVVDLCDRVLVLVDGQVVAELVGDQITERALAAGLAGGSAAVA
jgi:ribose transport system ATP-binding protein